MATLLKEREPEVFEVGQRLSYSLMGPRDKPALDGAFLPDAEGGAGRGLEKSRRRHHTGGGLKVSKSRGSGRVSG